LKSSVGGAEVHHVFAKAGIFALAFLIMLVFAAMASLGVSLSAVSLRSTVPSRSTVSSPGENVASTPAEIVASRFPFADAALPVQPAAFSTASVMPVERWERFDQDALSGVATSGVATSGVATSGVATAEPPWPTAAEGRAAIETTEPPISESTGESAATGETAPPKAQAASAPARRVTSRSSNVLNDAQIASVKQRLKLTAEQERMWPAVEAALRKIVYTKNAMNPQTRTAQPSGSPTAYIDPSSAEVRQLKSAALPLIMRLNDEQKREVKMLAYVMGLEAVVSQF
jgi:hypothetical protein